MFALLMWLIVGGLAGWLASIVMRTDAQQGIFLNIVVGIGGAMLGGLVLTRGAFTETPDVTSFVVALLGAIILLAIVNLFRRGNVR